jgi:hypothetical protein
MSLFGGVSGGGGSGSGTPGADGNTVLYGAGAPSAGTGVNGNFYIDTTAHAIYGPKTGGSWGAATSLIGPGGSSGIIYGNGAPANGTGADGNYYVDNTAHALYGPKAAGAWPAGISLVGPTGDAPLLALFLWGHGGDGNLTISAGQTQLQRDAYYNNLTINGTGTIWTNGYRVFVAGTLDLTNAPAGAINSSAVDAGQTMAGQAATYSATGLSAPGQANDLDGGNSTPSGPAGGTGVGTQANAATSMGVTPAGGSGGASGAGGASGTPNAGGASRGQNTTNGSVAIRRFNHDLWKGGSRIKGGNSGSAGSTGGGDGTNSSNGGPGGGAGAGIVWLAAKTILKGASTAAGAIAAKGAAAMNVTTPLQVGNIGGSGGGGGGGGGWVYLTYANLSGPDRHRT